MTGSSRHELIVTGTFAVCLMTAVAGLLWRYGGVLQIDRIWFVIAVSAVAGGFLLTGGLRRSPLLLPGPGLLIPMAVFAGWALAGSLFSIYIWNTLLALGLLLALAALFLSACSLRRETWLLAGTFTVGAVMVVYSFLQAGGWFPHAWWTEQEMVAGRFVNSNNFAAYVNLLFFPSLALVMTPGRKINRVFHVAFCTAAVVLLILSRSRGGMICWLLGVACFSFIALRRRRNVPRIVVSLLLCALVIGAGSFFGRRIIGARFAAWRTADNASFTQRLAIWKSSVIAVRHRPLGVGGGNFSVIYPLYRTHSDRFFVNFAHNELLEQAVERGIPGVLLAIWCLIAFLRNVRRDMNPLLCLGLLTGLGALLIHSLFDFPIRIPGVAAQAVVLAALLVRCERARNPVPVAYAGGLSLLLAACLVVPFRAEMYAMCAGKAEQTDWKTAVRCYEAGARWNPLKAEFHERAGFLASFHGILAGREVPFYRTLAESEYRAAVRRNAYDSFSWYGLALIYKRTGTIEQAKYCFEEAVLLNPTQGTFRLVYGQWLLDRGDTDAAVQMIKQGMQCFQEFVGFGTILTRVWQATGSIGQVMRVIPERADLCTEAAVFFYRMGERTRAIEYFRKACTLAVDPGNTAAYAVGFFTANNERSLAAEFAVLRDTYGKHQ